MPPYVFISALAFGVIGWFIGRRYGNPWGDAICCALTGPLGVAVCLVIACRHRRKARAQTGNSVTL